MTTPGRRKPVPCPACGKTFTKSQMRVHLRKEHGVEEEKTQCSECGLVCSARGYRSHMLSHREPQFQCGVCDKRVKTRATLVAHEREHTGERPFHCDVCGNGYKSKSVLAFHRRCVHKILAPGQAPYVRGKRKT